MAAPVTEFRKNTGLALGDVARIIFKDKITAAICADIGPQKKIGEGSIRLHEALHPPAPDPCRLRNPYGSCKRILNDEQDELFAQGRTRPGKIVTNARGGFSNHNFGIAWDIGIFNEKGEYIDDLIDKKMMTSKAVDAEYKKVGAYGKTRDLFWGGDWSDPDYPHFQMRNNNELASIRDAFTAGQAIV